jgi:hypothetical protein
MPVRYTIDPSTRFVHAVAEDEVTLDDIETFLDAVVVAEALPYRKLFDGRTAYGKYTDSDLMQLAARISAYAAVEKRGPTAIVPSRDYYELAARFINLNKNGPARVFLDVEEARRWLDAQPEVR